MHCALLHAPYESRPSRRNVSFFAHCITVLLLTAVPLAGCGQDFNRDRFDNWHHLASGPEATVVRRQGQSAAPLEPDHEYSLAGRNPRPRQRDADRLGRSGLHRDGRSRPTASPRPADLPKVDPNFERKTKAPDTYYHFVVMSFDRATGKPRWQHIAAEKVPHEGHHPRTRTPPAHPTTDGKSLYVSFGSFGIYCYDLAGKLHWQRDLGRLNTRLGWGEAVTPVIHGDSLLCSTGTRKRTPR